MGEGNALERARKAKARWGQVRADRVVKTVLTSELEHEHGEQVRNKYEFLVSYESFDNNCDAAHIDPSMHRSRIISPNSITSSASS